MEKEQMRILYERTAAQARLEISERTMKEISMELHDNVGQVLSSAAQALRQKSTTDRWLEPTVDRIEQALADIRNVSRSLNGDYIKNTGLLEALGREVNLVRASHNVQTHFNAPESIPDLDDKKQVLLFRCFQEALNNVLRHASATNVWIDLEIIRGSVLSVSIRDDGVGLPSSQRTDGIGMGSMQERAVMMGGRMILSSRQNVGTNIVFEVPFG